MKRYTKVKYQSHRGARSGTGKIVEVIETTRGRWYEVKDELTGEKIRLRASGLVAL